MQEKQRHKDLGILAKMARLRCAKTACQGRKNGGPPLRHNSVPGKEIAQDFGTAKHRSLNRMPIAGPFTSCFLTATSFLARSPRSGRGSADFYTYTICPENHEDWLPFQP
jgi:hypothetical protein